MIEAVIFDWAGTTVDYGCFAPVNAFLQAFEAIGLTVTTTEIRKPMGVLKKDHIISMLNEPRIATEFFELYGRAYTTADVETIYKHFEESLFTSLSSYATPIDGVIELVAWLKTRGIKIGSTTGYTSEMMGIVSAEAAKHGYIPDCMITPDIVGVGRPNPAMIQENMKCLQILTPGNIIKIGDTIADIEEGKNAGVISVGVILGSSELGKRESEVPTQSECEAIEAKYYQAGADYVLQKIEDLKMLIETLDEQE